MLWETIYVMGNDFYAWQRIFSVAKDFNIVGNDFLNLIVKFFVK